MSAPAAVRFHGPKIVVAGWLGHFVSVGFSLGIYGVFVELVAQDLGASMSQAGLGASLWQLMLGGGSPILGWFLVRRAARPIMLVGAVCVSLALLGLSQADRLWLAGACMLVLGLGSLMVGPLPANTLVAQWYTERRGTALGLAASGTTSATMVLPPAAAWLITQTGWRGSLLALAWVAALLSLPILYAWVVQRPSDLGQLPDGRAAAPTRVGPRPVISVRGLLAQPNLWLIAFAFGFLFAAGQVVLVFTVPFAERIGIPLVAGALILSARSGCGIVGKIVMGSLTDRFDARWVLGGAVVLQLALWLLLTLVPSFAAFLVAALGLGFATAGILPVQANMVSRVFGPEAFGQAMGLMNGLRLPFNLAALPLAGYWIDQAGGDVGLGLRGFLPVFVLALALVPFIRMAGPEASTRSAT